MGNYIMAKLEILNSKQQVQGSNDLYDWDKTLPAINWLMYLCDGQKTLLDIVEHTKLNFDLLSDTAILLEKNELLERI